MIGVDAPLSLDETAFTDGTIRPTRHEAFMTTLWASEAMVSSSADLLDRSEALFSRKVLGPAGTATLLA